jgi:hypothetical protein
MNGLAAVMALAVLKPLRQRMLAKSSSHADSEAEAAAAEPLPQMIAQPK